MESPNDGVQNSFSTYMLCLGKNAGPDSMIGGSYDAERGYGEIKGDLRVPRNEKSMFTCGAEIQHGIMLRLFSEQLLRPIIAQTSIFLPSGSG